jgi:peroxiredoxin-like protein
MSEKIEFHLDSHWTEARRGRVEAEGAGLPIEFSAPPEFQGQAGYWTPEHFFLAAVASCFITTFRAIAEASRFEAVSLQVSADGFVEKVNGGYEFTQVVLKPRLTVRNETDRERAVRLLEKTERACLVSRSLKSKVAMEPLIDVAGTQSAAREEELASVRG